MQSFLPKIDSKEWNFETVAFIFYLISVSCTVLGPVVHYVGWGVTLLALLYGKIRYGASLAIEVPKESKPAFYTLLLFAFWCMFPNAINADSFYIWGKGASVYLEMLLGVYFTMRVVNSEPKRTYMGLAIVALNTIFSVGYIVSYYFAFDMLNHSMQNGNTLGEYAVMVMPFMAWYSFAYFKENHLLKLIVCGINAVLILISMSSGAWLATIVQVLVLLYFIIVQQHVKLILIASYILFIIVAIIVFNIATNGRLYQNFQIEKQQTVNINDLNKLTNTRYDIWRATYYMSKSHLFAGRGRVYFPSDYENRYQEFFNNISEFKREGMVFEPHNMYIATLYTGGLPGVFLFIAIFCHIIMITIYSLKKSNGEKKFWTVICLVAIIGYLTYGIGADIFEARRDNAVISWFVVGMVLLLPSMRNLNKY